MSLLCYTCVTPSLHFIVIMSGTLNETNVLRCVQINLRKARTPSIVLALRSEEICFLTEPFQSRNLSYLRTNGRDVFGKVHGRSAICIHRSLFPWPVEDLTTSDICTVLAQVGENQVLLCSVYMDINNQIDDPALLKVMDYAACSRLGLLLAADCNAHSPLWAVMCQMPEVRNSRI